MSKTKIEWTEFSWNPVIGCSKVSEGCQNCYAEKMAIRLASMGHKKYQAVIGYLNNTFQWLGYPYCDESILEKPLHWRKPRRIFVCSMSDLFHEKVPFEFIDEILGIMFDTPQHTYQVLTKRVDRALEFWKIAMKYHRLPKNLHFGITCENQRCADERIPIALQIPAAKRFVSLEPLLGEIDLTNCDGCDVITAKNDKFWDGLEKLRPVFIDQVIIGCENLNGKAGRFCEDEQRFYKAVENIIDQCDSAGVKVHIKQIPINGRVCHNPEQWPEKFRRRENL